MEVKLSNDINFKLIRCLVFKRFVWPVVVVIVHIFFNTFF